MITLVLRVCDQKRTVFNDIERDYLTLVLGLHMPPVDQCAFVNALDFSTSLRHLTQHLDEGKQVVVRADFAGEEKDKPPKHTSKSGVINKDEITLLIVVKIWVAA